MDDAMFVNGQFALHGQGVVFFRYEVLEVLTVLDGAADMQVDKIHVVHGGGVDLAVQAECFCQMCDLQRAGDAVLPTDIRADDIGSVLSNDLRHTPVAAAGGLGGSDRDIQCAAQLGVFIQLKVAEGLFEPLIIQPFQLTSHGDGFVDGIVAHGVGHQQVVGADSVADGAGIDRQAVAASADVLIKRKPGFLGTDIPQGYIHGAGQEHGKECLMTVDGPQFLEDGLTVMGVTSQNNRADALL